MYNLNYKYKDDELLKSWLKEHNIASQKECLVQFFSGIAKEKEMQNISALLTTLLPSAHIIGVTTDGEICEDEVSLNEI
ncbi:MAG: hypothetical protein K8R44_04285, partial [Sulfurimonas sp.]|nr:hypothetical protein [Sulfurimonas sp.]